MQFVTGVDLGGTNIVVGTVAVDGSAVHGLLSKPTRADLGVDGVIDRIVDMVHASLQVAAESAGSAVREHILGIGVGAPGPLHRERGLVRVAPNLGWHDVPLRDRLSQALALPVAIDNDANCAVYGEWWQGGGQGVRHLVGITIGTGIGGAFLVNGRLYHGASDVAGEVGHMTIDSTGRRCNCGNYGCLEAYASGPAIAQRAVEGIEAGEITGIAEYVTGDLKLVTAETVYQAAHDGDEFARQVVQDTARFLGTGVANLVNIFNPDLVLILGGVTKAGDRLFRPLQAEVTRRAFGPAVEVCRIVPGILIGRAGVYGAAKIFLDQQR